MQVDVSACLRPLPAGAGSDADLRLDPDHERLLAEVAKLSSPVGEPVDWQLVEQLAQAILSQRAKDLTAAAFLAAARFERAGWQGLLQGCELLHGLVRSFPSELTPRRPRARANALGWWLARVTLRMAGAGPAEQARLAACTRALQALEHATSALLAADAPSFAELRSALEQATSRAARAERAEPAHSEPPSTTAATPPLPPRATTLELPSASDQAGIARFLRVQGSSLVELARACADADPRDARAYRWLRTALWLTWEDAPPVGKHGRTAVAAPLASARGELLQARAEGRWQDLLRASEALLVVVPHWLELGLLSAEALRALGPQFTRALAAVEGETRALHARIPLLATRTFRDGTPFASASALAWLNSGAVSAAPPSVLPEPHEATDSTAGLLRALESAPSPRAQFLLRGQLARRLLETGELARARSIYQGMLAELDALSLERWEPELAIEVVRALSGLADARTPAGVRDAESASLYVRLARLAPWLAAGSIP